MNSEFDIQCSTIIEIPIYQDNQIKGRVDKMEDEKVQDATTRLESGLSRRDFVKRGLAVGQAVFIGGVLVGNFAGCTTAPKKDKEIEAGRKKSITLAHITDTHVTFSGKNGTAAP